MSRQTLRLLVALTLILPAYATAHPACDIALADVDCSGVADPSDLGPFVQLLLRP